MLCALYVYFGKVLCIFAAVMKKTHYKYKIINVHFFTRNNINTKIYTYIKMLIERIIVDASEKKNRNIYILKLANEKSGQVSRFYCV